ncbi:hypothetical protein QJS04_geneDACA010388 [Acorus gramineus]|uniref:Uncharacterized protein n=1 Tax=Acorus gramineus TaxID=55184 RepID=A0AAV9A7A5_ACOGR|nr:hypothetical protein QJS04_geneDACA010388 [Acorus gramineus]
MVTGASSGIGREVCLDLAGAGCAIIAAARRTDRLASLCEEINGGAMGPAKAVELDISAAGPMIEAAVQRAWEAFGRVDVLVNNAGIRGDTGILVNKLMYPGGVHSPLELSEEEWNNVIQTNLTGTWLVSKYIARRMHDANIKGSIINISSIAGLNRGHWPGGISYAASKSGVNTISRVMALELGPYKIRVNSISPGLFKSEITEKLMQKDWLKNVAMRMVPLRTFGTTHPALTSLVRYLIHDLSGYVTGNDFIIDAGLTLVGVPIFSSL